MSNVDFYASYAEEPSQEYSTHGHVEYFIFRKGNDVSVSFTIKKSKQIINITPRMNVIAVSDWIQCRKIGEMRNKIRRYYDDKSQREMQKVANEKGIQMLSLLLVATRFNDVIDEFVAPSCRQMALSLDD